ncbi:hypothetical protein HPHPA16_0404 [Helicobacter pylori Hp A-16]|nr:hypothetical protein HPHPA16_0404 [Helicobacter pylori Hp A-16]
MSCRRFAHEIKDKGRGGFCRCLKAIEGKNLKNAKKRFLQYKYKKA